MFDISWTEFLLIGVIALIVIGPKELPGVLRTLGQYTRKVRSMAAEFQNQFQEAMREAEMADLKKQVDDMAQDLKDFDPLKGVREDVEAAGRDIEHSLNRQPEGKPALPVAGEPAATDGQTDASTAASDNAAAPAAESAAPLAAVERSELETIGANGPATPAEPAAQADGADSTGRPA
jgi:sec-independent protein translocase protein TatB